MKTTITYCGVRLECEFEYYPPEAPDSMHPGFPSYVALETCKVAGVEIQEMLSNAQQDEIETLIAQEQDENYAEAQYDRQQERLMENQFP